jgi:hypothetical protein
MSTAEVPSERRLRSMSISWRPRSSSSRPTKKELGRNLSGWMKRGCWSPPLRTKSLSRRGKELTLFGGASISRGWAWILNGDSTSLWEGVSRSFSGASGSIGMGGGIPTAGVCSGSGKAVSLLGTVLPSTTRKNINNQPAVLEYDDEDVACDGLAASSSISSTSIDRRV